MGHVHEAHMTYDLLGHGIYAFPEAARLAHVSVQRLRAWFRGWPARLGPIIQPRHEDHVPGSNLITFLDLVDSLVVARLREHGISMQYLRKVNTRLKDCLSPSHPFAHRNLLTDGKKVFVELADEFNERNLKELLSQQHAFPILRAYLKQIEYDARTLVALRWHVREGIVIDPQREFGKPIVDSAGIPTAVIDAAYRANGTDCDRVADWYGISPTDVRAAVEFEEHLRRRAA